MTKTKNQSIKIAYSEDFMEIPSKIYRILRKNNLNPESVSGDYFPSKREGVVKYIFSSAKKIPEKSDLLKMLDKIKIKSLELEKPSNYSFEWIDVLDEGEDETF